MFTELTFKGSNPARDRFVKRMQAAGLIAWNNARKPAKVHVECPTFADQQLAREIALECGMEF